MRISSNLFFQTGLNSINAQQSDLMHLYQQIGSGQRMVTPADDPLAAAQAINISQSQTLNARFAANREVLKNNLGVEENTLNSVTTLIQDVKTQLISAGNGTLSDADRATLSNVLANARTSLLGLANATDGSGQYLFSGSKGGTAPFSVNSAGRIDYVGDEGQRKIQADQTRQIAGSDVGSDIFNRAAPGTNNYLTRAVGNAGLPNAGTGLISTPTITDPKGANIGNTFTVKFLNATDYEVNVIDAAGAAVGTTISGSITGTTTSIDLPGGVQVKFSGKPANGDTFVVEPATQPDYAASTTTSIAGKVSSPTIYNAAATKAGYSFSIEFSDATNYAVVVRDANNNVIVPTGDQAGFSTGTYNGIEQLITLPFGVQVKLSGATVALDQFAIKPAAASAAADLNIFDTLDSIISSLNTSLADPVATAAFQNTLATAMQRLDVNYDNVLTVRASVGARLNEIDALHANGSMRSLSYSNQLSKLEDVDYYSATTQLQLRTTALEAASMAFKKIQSIGLFNQR